MSDPLIVPVQDIAHPSVVADMVYERADSGELALAEIRIRAAEGAALLIAGLGPLPLARWDRSARFQAATERGEPVEELALARVRTLHPDLGPISRGNAQRRWSSLVGLAKAAEEYGRLAASGHSNPALLLASRYGVSTTTIRSWLHRARREGLAPTSTHPNATVNRQRSES
ncbi:helix-turn-helix domain-containing protein [Streptomyces longwoodensis]|uniref:helix-turn-helix domain-containing protein n=1 Tax=Streptomyces longwoodensis TaxID=68231 RepID=UPI002DDC073A|nr:hypothetical protein [Streptomyces longwoodensis]WRY87419.1 helix-turn-helix domain-containing protein [Streptomyces longwoodensis]